MNVDDMITDVDVVTTHPHHLLRVFHHLKDLAQRFLLVHLLKDLMQEPNWWTQSSMSLGKATHFISIQFV